MQHELSSRNSSADTMTTFDDTDGDPNYDFTKD